MIQYLDWDSNFFGYPVGSIEIKKDLDEKDLEQAIHFEKESYRLIYLFSPAYKVLSSSFCSGLGIELVDEKVIYKKQLLRTDYIFEVSEEIKSIIGSEYFAYKHLALQSGIYSRFKIDRRFKNNEFERMYEEWLKNSLNKKNANECLAYYLNDIPIGIITIKTRESNANIGIIAVDSSFRGIGVGKKLLYAVEQFSLLNGFDYITVATQKRNDIACKFYESNSYQVEQITKIYHFWNNEYNPL